jgi:protein gp37
MAQTKIEWSDAVWNPVTGCDRVSLGCDRCYALTLAKRLKAMGQPKYQRDGDPRTSGPGFGLTLHPDAIDQPLHWRSPRFVFVNSMSDLFHPEVPADFIWRVFGTMAQAGQHAFQVLTKRPQRAASLLARWKTALDAMPDSPSLPLPNVWIGTSIESDRYSWRADRLRATPAAIRFLSLEPLLGDLPSLNLTAIDWVIVGGESGHAARPLDLGWVRDVRDRCADTGVALFVKQLGSAWSIEHGHGPAHGVDWTLWPRDLRIREMPGVGLRHGELDHATSRERATAVAPFDVHDETVRLHRRERLALQV